MLRTKKKKSCIFTHNKNDEMTSINRSAVYQKPSGIPLSAQFQCLEKAIKRSSAFATVSIPSSLKCQNVYNLNNVSIRSFSLVAPLYITPLSLFAACRLNKMSHSTSPSARAREKRHGPRRGIIGPRAKDTSAINYSLTYALAFSVL